MAKQSTQYPSRCAVVTGASTGIGEASVRSLCARGWTVIALARRAERLKSLAQETACVWQAVDLTDENAVTELAQKISAEHRIDAVVNVAGGALGVETVADALSDKWLEMYQRNVMTALHTTRAFLPQLRTYGGDVLFVTSTAAHDTYPGGGGYVAAKHAERIIANTMRQELVGEPVRVMELAPGMVKTEEFSLNRLGDAQAAANVYAGVDHPLLAEDIAEAIVWMLERPTHVNIDSMIVRPRAQATNTLIHRTI